MSNLPEHLEPAILAAWPSLPCHQQRLWWQVLIVLLPADSALLDALQEWVGTLCGNPTHS